MEFSSRKVEGGWIVTIQGNDYTEKVIAKDSDLIKQFKEFVESSKVQTLNE